MGNDLTKEISAFLTFIFPQVSVTKVPLTIGRWTSPQSSYKTYKGVDLRLEGFMDRGPYKKRIQNWASQRRGFLLQAQVPGWTSESLKTVASLARQNVQMEFL